MPEQQTAETKLVDLQQLVAAANDGDQEALADLRQLLDEHPEIWQKLGDMALHARSTLVRLVSNGDELLSESLTRKLAELRTSLSRPNATPLEKLAIDRLVLAWVTLHDADTKLASSTPGTVQATFWLKRQNQAERSYAAASRALSDLQRLLPAVTQTPAEAKAARARTFRVQGSD